MTTSHLQSAPSVREPIRDLRHAHLGYFRETLFVFLCWIRVSAVSINIACLQNMLSRKIIDKITIFFQGKIIWVRYKKNVHYRKGFTYKSIASKAEPYLVKFLFSVVILHGKSS